MPAPSPLPRPHTWAHTGLLPATCLPCPSSCPSNKAAWTSPSKASLVIAASVGTGARCTRPPAGHIHPRWPAEGGQHWEPDTCVPPGVRPQASPGPSASAPPPARGRVGGPSSTGNRHPTRRPGGTQSPGRRRPLRLSAGARGSPCQERRHVLLVPYSPEQEILQDYTARLGLSFSPRTTELEEKMKGQPQAPQVTVLGGGPPAWGPCQKQRRLRWEQTRSP